MGQIDNFPGDPRFKGLPDEIRKRFRGRSVPSPRIGADIKPKPIKEFLVAKTVIPLNLSLVANTKHDFFIAATDWVVQGISMKVPVAGATITLVASTEEGNEVTKVIPQNSKRAITIISGFEEISFLFKAGETISILSSLDVDLIGSIELVQTGGKIIRTDDTVSEGTPPGDPA